MIRWVFRQLSILAICSPEEIRVQVYSGQVGNDGELLTGNAIDLETTENLGDGKYRFNGSIHAGSSGRYGFAIRALPGGVNFEGMVIPGLILWENPGVYRKNSENKTPEAQAVKN